jgi:predicted nucleotide-binding protein
MAKKSGQPQERPRLSVTREEAKARVHQQIQRGEATPNASINENDEARRWYEFTAEMLRQIFTTDEVQDEFTGRFSLSFGDSDISTSAYLKKLRSIHERLDLFPAPAEGSDALGPREPSQRARSGPATKVFVVHGHDEGARESTARFLEQLGLQAVVLHEQANSGRTIIEKLEASGDVDYALILLTPDDVGAGVSRRDDLKPRARQNVILELGYFFGRLGRRRVCALHKGNVEIPSDYHGIVYVPMDDAGAWRLLVARELRSAGFNVDLNVIP